MADKHRLKVLNIGETARLEKVTARLNKEKQYLAKELRDIQDARLLFEANRKSRHEKRRRLSEPARPQTEPLRRIQNSNEISSGPNNSHQPSSPRLSPSSSHSTLHKPLVRLKNEEFSSQQHARRLSMSNTPERWTLGSWESYQRPSEQRIRRISLPTVAPVTRVISSKSGKLRKEDLLNANGSSKHISKSLSNLVPANLNLSSSAENIRQINCIYYKNQQSRSTRGWELSKSCNLHQETEMNSRGASPCVPVEEDVIEGSLRKLRVMSGQVCERESKNNSGDTVLIGYPRGKLRKSIEEDSNKLKLPVIALSRSPSPLSYTDNGFPNDNEGFKESRKISPSQQTLEHLAKRGHNKREIRSKDERRRSGEEEEEEAKVYTSAEEIKRKKAVELERLTRSSVELEQAMMSKFKRIGVGEMGHLLLKTAKVVENVERMDAPGVISTHGSRGSTVVLSAPGLKAITDPSDTFSQPW